MIKKALTVSLVFLLLLCSCGTSSSDVDFDLTRMSSTMVYSEVLHMLMDPEVYDGKTVRMEGTFLSWINQDGNDTYSCVIADATACCSQGMEFSFAEGAEPKEMPEEDHDITVTGTFRLYEEDGVNYGYVADATMKVSAYNW